MVQGLKGLCVGVSVCVCVCQSAFVRVRVCVCVGVLVRGGVLVDVRCLCASEVVFV